MNNNKTQKFIRTAGVTTLLPEFILSIARKFFPSLVSEMEHGEGAVKNITNILGKTEKDSGMLSTLNVWNKNPKLVLSNPVTTTQLQQYIEKYKKSIFPKQSTPIGNIIKGSEEARLNSIVVDQNLAAVLNGSQAHAKIVASLPKLQKALQVGGVAGAIGVAGYYKLKNLPKFNRISPSSNNKFVPYGYTPEFQQAYQNVGSEQFMQENTGIPSSNYSNINFYNKLKDPLFHANIDKLADRYYGFYQDMRKQGYTPQNASSQVLNHIRFNQSNEFLNYMLDKFKDLAPMLNNITSSPTVVSPIQSQGYTHPLPSV